MIRVSVAPMHPREFRKIHELSIKEISKLSNIPSPTLQNYFAHPDSTRHSRTPDHVLILFGLLHEKLSQTN